MTRIGIIGDFDARHHTHVAMNAALELPGHRFFIATLFHPQLGSRPGRPHPFMAAFVKAANEPV